MPCIDSYPQINYFLGVEGTLDEDMNIAMSSALEASVPTPGFKWYWRQRGDHFTEAFKSFVNQIAASHPEGGAEIIWRDKKVGDLSQFLGVAQTSTGICGATHRMPLTVSTASP